MPLLRGEVQATRDAVFCEGGRLREERHCSESQSRGAHDPDDLYWPRVSVQQSDEGEHTKATMCRTAEWKYVCRLDEDDELYDLRSDPQELTNLVYDPKAAQVLAEMRERLLSWYQATCDVVPFAANSRQ